MSSEHLRPVLEVPNEDDDYIPESAVSPASARRDHHVSPIKEFSPQNLFRRIGYQRMPSDGGVQELANLEEHGNVGGSRDGESGHVHHRLQSPPQLPHSSPPPTAQGAEGLGISMHSSRRHNHSRSSSFSRVPVGSKGIVSSPEETPRSEQGLLFTGTPSSTAVPWSPPIFSPMGKDSVYHDVPMPSHIPHQSATTQQTSVGDSDNRGSNKHNSPGTFTRLFSSRWAQKKHQASVRVTDTPGTTSSVPDTPGDIDDDDDFDDEKFHKGYSQPPSYCLSRRDIRENRTSWLSLTIFTLSVYSTVLSGIWLIVSIVQPRWGRGISSQYGLHPSTATTVTALVAKTIELSFVTVFISCLGQVLTRRALVRSAGGRGMTLAEMNMRNWVLQPGSLVTHYNILPTVGLTVFGALALTATIAATFYTTASDAMVAPKLKYGGWESRQLEGYISSAYANVQYAQATCANLPEESDPSGVITKNSEESCMALQFSGQSYRNLMNFMTVWSGINENGTGASDDLAQRPNGTTLLFDNTTMVSSWIETHASNVTALYGNYSRIVNNVSLAMPHPGVYGAAKSPHNGILQPDELAGVGEYAVRAGVVSPSINVLCVNMDEEELAPLVYTAWPDAQTRATGVQNQTIGWEGWQSEVPNPDAWDEVRNKTKVDKIFRWGKDYNRHRPVFQLYPADYNMLTNSTVNPSDSIYILGKSPSMANYTLCEMKSWVSPKCSTRFDISGISGATMRSHCEDRNDRDSYLRSHDEKTTFPGPEMNWKWLADSWRLSMYLNGGSTNDNASNARILTQLALTDSSLSKVLPSLAEALAVYASSTLTIGAIDTPFTHWWDYPETIISPLSQSFNASVRTQEYTSGHVADWQNIFYLVLALVFAMNVSCLLYFITYAGLVTDFTEPQNLFALAVNSPPSVQLKGSCGGGPEKRDLLVPWRVAFAPSANHYFFEEANDRPWKGKYAVDEYNNNYNDPGVMAGMERPQVRGSSYKRLSSGKVWI